MQENSSSAHNSRLRRRLGHLFLFALLLLPAFAQSQINVKARARSSAAALLDWQVQHPTARMAMPGLEAITAATHVQRLAPAQQLDGIFTLQFPESADLDAQIAALLATGQFEWVERNRTRQAYACPPVAPPNDPKVADQWYHDYIRTFEAWDTTRGDNTVVIGVLDTGLDYGHPEFAGQVAIKSDEDINGNGTFEAWPDTVLIDGITGDLDDVDQDGNGYTDDVIGWDFTDQPRSPFGGDYLFEDPNPQDDNNHGTLVSGIIAARADNNYGGTGIAPNCRLKVLRAFSANGSGEDDDIARAIVYAADEGIKILNFSFGDIYPSEMMHAAVQYAASKGVVMIASAGNGTGDNLHYPSNFDEVIAVSASAIGFGDDEILWPLSSYGHAVSLCAPGSGVYAPMVRDTANEEDFDFFSGTSTSAPMVSAAVGLLFAQRGACSPQQVRGLLTSTADDIGEAGWDHFTGAGRLNISKLLQAVGASEVQILWPVNDGGSDQAAVPVAVTALDPQFLRYHLEYQSGTAGNDDWTPIVTDIAVQAHRDTVATWQVGQLPQGEYTLRLRMEKTNGTTAEDRIRFVVDRSIPQVEVRYAGHAWDNEQQKFFWVYRSSDRARTSLYYRPVGASTWASMPHDRTTRHGEFLLGIDQLPAGPFEWYITATNEAGNSASTPVQTSTYSPEFIALDGYDTLAYSIPMGHYLDQVTDFDGDGLEEVVMSEYDAQLGFGRLKFHEFNATQFTAADSITTKPILIPKDIADTDGDGLQELLASVNDSIYLFEQGASLTYPKSLEYSNFGNDLFAARFGNTDADPALEMLAKDFEDYKVLDGAANAGFSLTQTLADVSGGYLGSVAPRALVQDFDGDGMNEVIFGDFDGDFLVYEFDGTAYRRTFTDTTTLTKSGSFLTAGDFDGDGQMEFFVATHTSLNRNEVDFEYEPLYWRLRIFEATADNQYAAVWENVLFDIDTEDFNAATAGNLDQDPWDELVFTTFPRTYIIDHTPAGYTMDWFHYGDLATHHVIADFNHDGVNEVALGRGDKAQFWQQDFSYTGPPAVAWLDGQVGGPDRTALRWSAASTASGYRLWRGPITGNGSILINLIDSTAATTYIDSVGLTAGVDYLYVLESKRTAPSLAYSPFSYAIVLRPHALGRLDSVVATGPLQAVAHFSVPVAAAPETAPAILLNDSIACRSVNASGDRHLSVLLSFADTLAVGTNLLTLDSTFLDALRAPLQPTGRSASFVYAPDTAQQAFFTAWEVVDNDEAQIHFNLAMANSVLDLSRWQLAPSGAVVDVRWADGSQESVIVTITGAALGALGYPVSMILNGGAAQNGAPMKDKSGNVATFSAHQDDNSQAYVYPNPYRSHTEFNGVRFANLSQTATIHVYAVSGRKVITLEETDGDGGLEWNLVDMWGDRIAPGVYLFKVQAEGVEDFLGKFEVLD